MSIEEGGERTNLSVATIRGSGLEEMWEGRFECVEGAEDVDVHDGFECVCG